MARLQDTYRGSGRYASRVESRYQPAVKSGREWPPEQKGKQEAARRLRQMGKQAATPEPSVVVGAGKDADPPPGLFSRLVAKVLP